MIQKLVGDLKKIKQVRSLGRKVKFAGRVFKRMFTRDPDLIMFSTKVAFNKATRKPLKSAGSSSTTQRAESYAMEGLTYHQDVVSIPLKEGKLKDYAGGIIDSKTFSLIDEALYFNYRKSFSQELPGLDLPGLVSSTLAEITHPVVFGGLLWNNFGHFILESLSRLWAYDHVRALDPYILFYVNWVPPKYLEKKNYAYQVLSGFNIPHNRVLVTYQPVRIHELLIPAQKYGYEFCKHPDAHFLKFVRSFRFPQSVPRGFEKADKLYVSRSKIPDGSGKPVGEKLFDDYLVRNGYTVFHPEFYTIYEQLTIYSRASKIIFCDGGALHGCILLPDLAASIAVIARRKDRDYDCREILEQFEGYNKEVLWVDSVKSQYQFGLASWDAVAVVDWFEVSVQLKANGFVRHQFDEYRHMNQQDIIHKELMRHVKAVSTKPGFVDFLIKLPEPDQNNPRPKESKLP